MKKLLEIPWDILDDKWIKHKFDVKNRLSGIIG